MARGERARSVPPKGRRNTWKSGVCQRAVCQRRDLRGTCPARRPFRTARHTGRWTHRCTSSPWGTPDPTSTRPARAPCTRLRHIRTRGRIRRSSCSTAKAAAGVPRTSPSDHRRRTRFRTGTRTHRRSWSLWCSPCCSSIDRAAASFRSSPGRTPSARWASACTLRRSCSTREAPSTCQACRPWRSPRRRGTPTRRGRPSRPPRSLGSTSTCRAGAAVCRPRSRSEGRRRTSRSRTWRRGNSSQEPPPSLPCLRCPRCLRSRQRRRNRPPRCRRRRSSRRLHRRRFPPCLRCSHRRWWSNHRSPARPNPRARRPRSESAWPSSLQGPCQHQLAGRGPGAGRFVPDRDRRIRFSAPGRTTHRRRPARRPAAPPQGRTRP